MAIWEISARRVTRAPTSFYYFAILYAPHKVIFWQPLSLTSSSACVSASKSCRARELPTNYWGYLVIVLTKRYSITFAHSSCNKDKIHIKSWQYQLLSKYNSNGQPWKRIRPKFDHEVGQIRKRGRPLQKPRGASKWQSTNEKLELSWYIQHRETIQLQIRIAFSWPNVETSNAIKWCRISTALGKPNSPPGIQLKGPLMMSNHVIKGKIMSNFDCPQHTG